MAEMRDLLSKIDGISNEGVMSAASRLMPGLGFASNAYDLYNGEYLKAGLGLIANTLELFPPTYPLGAGINVGMAAHDISQAVSEPTPNTQIPTVDGDATDRANAAREVGQRLSGRKVEQVASQTPNVVANTEAATALSQQTDPLTTDDISSVVGNNLSPEAISKLAAEAAKYALPAVAIIALLYGGKVLYDYLTSAAKENPSAKHSLAEMIETVRAERMIRETR